MISKTSNNNQSSFLENNNLNKQITDNNQQKFLNKVIRWKKQAWEKVTEWTQDGSEKINDFLKDNEYVAKIRQRSLLTGLPFSILSGGVAAYLFKGASIYHGMIFSVVNYAACTSLAEVLGINKFRIEVNAPLSIGLSAAISWAFIETICKTTLSSKTVFILAIASGAGQLARNYFIARQINNGNVE